MQPRRTTHLSRAGAGLLALALILTGCYRPAPQPTIPPPPPTITPLPPDVPDVRISGSSFVGEVTEMIAADFKAWQPHYAVTLDASGTSHGFEQMCQGEADLVNAVRPISGEEITACTRSGADWLEIIIAYDVLVAVANPKDAFLDCLELAEMGAAWQGDDTWSDIRRSFPTLPVTVFDANLHPAQDRFFMDATGIEALRPDVMPAGTRDPVVLVSETPGAVAYLKYGDYKAAEEAGLVRRVALDAGQGCVAPTPENVWNETYGALARPMYLYINVASLRRLSMSLFVGYYLSAEGQARITEAGYLPASPESYERARAAVDARTGQ